MKGIGKAFIQNGCAFRGFGTQIGDGSYVNTGVHFDDTAPVRLGKHVFVGPGAMFLTATHEVGTIDQRAGTSAHIPVAVEDGSWVGARAIILPGVTVGAGCVIGAGSVVTKDCEPNGLYLGVPARRVRELDV